MEIRVVEPGSGRPLPADEVGELRVRGCVTPGYYRDPEQTRAAFDAEGCFITGDLGTVGDDGRIRFRGRLKEMIKTGGINVAPLEVEGVLLTHPAVKQAYVVGLPDRSKGEVAAAGVNYADAIMVAGKYQTRPAFPFSPGLETAGVVAACGEGVTRFAPGDRVMAILAYGGLAEVAVADEAETFAVPDAMPFDE